jgi:CheY-like chemotaxis protein
MERKHLSILWIEDQLDDFIGGAWEILKVELGKQGFDLKGDGPAVAKRVDAAEQALDGYSTPECKAPDVILLDLMLPMDTEDERDGRVDLDAGYLIWFQIRHLGRWPLLADIPIIIITARGRPEYMDQMCADPQTQWIPKPADPVTVAQRIMDVVGLCGTKQRDASEVQRVAHPATEESGGNA